MTLCGRFEGSCHVDLPTFSKHASLFISYACSAHHLDLHPRIIVHQSALPEKEPTQTEQDLLVTTPYSSGGLSSIPEPRSWLGSHGARLLQMC